MRRFPVVLLAVAFAGVSTSCTQDDPSLAVSTTATGLGVRAYIDNCPAATAVRVKAGGSVLWEIERSAPTREEPSELDVLVGEAPPGWLQTVALAAPLEAGTTYTLSTGPEGDILGFDLDQLEPGRILTETGEQQATPARIERECPEETISGSEFWRDIVLLTLLGLSAVAAIGIIVLLVLHVLNRALRRPTV